VSAAPAQSSHAFAARTATVAALSGGAAGFLFGGIGGRIAMRLSAQIDRDAHGLLTENGEVVGEFTLAGTIAFIVFMGLFGGLIVGFLWTLLAPWLPEGPRARRASAVVIGAALGSRMGIDGSNFDFRILDPPLVQASIFIALAGATGWGVVAIESRLAKRLPQPQAGLSVAYWSTVVVGALMAVPFTMLYFSNEDCCVRAPWVVGITIIVLEMLWVARLVYRARGRNAPSWLTRAGALNVAAMTIAGFAHLAGEIAHFT
jgi:hypothetical protein